MSLVAFKLTMRLPRKNHPQPGMVMNITYYSSLLLALALVMLFKLSEGFSTATHIVSALTVAAAIATFLMAMKADLPKLKARMCILIATVILGNALIAYLQ